MCATQVISMAVWGAKHLRRLGYEARLDEGRPAVSAVEALRSGVIVVIVEDDPLIKRGDLLFASAANLAKHFVVTFQTVRILVARDILASRQRSIARVATEMLDVPRFAFGLSVSFVENQLVACGTPGHHRVGKVATAVQTARLEEVNQILQHFVARAANKAGRVPALVVARSGGKDGDVPRVHRLLALEAQPLRVGRLLRNDSLSNHVLFHIVNVVVQHVGLDRR